jgi:hypothetical protein
MLLDELEEIKNKRSYMLKLTVENAELSLEIKEWSNEELTRGYREKYYSKISNIMELGSDLENYRLQTI